MPNTKPPYPEEFRREAIDLVLSGRSVPDVAAALGVAQGSLRNWIKQYERDSGRRDDGLKTDEREELSRLRRENARLRQEKEILKKAAAFFARESETP